MRDAAIMAQKGARRLFAIIISGHLCAVDIWLGGHTHTHPDDVLNSSSHVERA